MTSRSFPYTPFTGSPGAYCDALPTGEFVAYLPGDRCETHLGPIDFLDHEMQPLFVRINPVGPFEFAAVGWEGRQKDHVLTWDGQWHVRPEKACGSSPVIYDNFGTLHICPCPAPQVIGTQGWRYVTPENELVTGDATYAPTTTIPLNEWTQLLPDLYIGQGRGDDGVYVVDRGTLRVLTEHVGLCRFVRARVSGQQVSIAWWGQGTHTTEFRWLTVDELRALPAYVPPAPPPTPVPPPAPPPIEVPMTPDHSTTIAAVYAEGGFNLSTKYGCGLFTEACARALHQRDPRWGHLLKRPGQNQFRGHAVDAVLYRHDNLSASVAIDLISDSESPTASVVWNPDIPRYSPSDWIAPEPIPVSRAVRPSLPFLAAGSCFDLGVSLDFDLVAEMKAAGVTTVRVMVTRRDRTLEEGRNQLKALLPRLVAAGVKASVVVNVDMGLRDYSADAAYEHTRLTNAVLVAFPQAVALVELFNENSHEVEQPYATDPYVLRDLDALIDPRFPVAWGANHGGEAVSDRLAGGSVICYHSDRALSPEENADIMFVNQDRYHKKIVNMEPKGMDEVARGSSRTDDPAFIERQAKADKSAGLGGSCYHFEAGLSARSAMPPYGPKQREALRLFGAALTGTPVPPQPPIPVPPTPPPSSSDPILDAPLSPAYPVGYQFFVHHFAAIQTEAKAWYARAYNRLPADSDIAHGLWRALNEGERWGTLRGAWTEAWPGGGR